MLGNVSLLAAMIVYARNVILDAEGSLLRDELPPEKTDRWPKQRTRGGRRYGRYPVAKG